MRHSTITLTMDTYGHLFPGQETDAVAGMRDVLFALPKLAEALRATGTDDAMPEVRITRSARFSAQTAKRDESMRRRATNGPSRTSQKNRPSLCKLQT